MKMKLTFTLIFLSVNCIVSYSQTIDTITLWDKLQLVTDMSLNDSSNCLVIDTLITFHACNNYHGEDIVLKYYKLNQVFCNSINAIANQEQRNYALSKHKRNLHQDQVKSIRLIPENSWKNDLYYSPEILFKLRLGESEYNFNSFETTYVISEKELDNGINILERIQNGFGIFGKVDCEVTYFIGHERYVISRSEEKHKWHYPKTNFEKIDQVKIVISNNCSDTLQMNFHIIRQK